MTAYDYDLFVIGGGSGGVRGARMAAATGARVALAEEFRYGGTCVIRGCVPKKLFSYAAHFHEEFEDAAGFGWNVGESTFEWSSLIANKDKEIDRLEGIYRKLLANAGVETFDGRACLLDNHRVEFAGKVISAEKILIAVGGHPVTPATPGMEFAVSSNECFHLEEFPGRVVVYGGGYIAVEFAGIFNGLGAEVTEVYRGEQILRGFDWDVRHSLAEEMTKKGINIRLGVTITNVEKTADGLSIYLSDGSQIDCDLLLAATGRKPNTDDLGLKAAGVEVDAKGAIAVDAYSKTSQDNIYAVGDVTDRIALTPVAIHEAMAFVDTVYRGTPRAMDHNLVASAVFSHPNVASIGLSEEDARKSHGAVEIYRSTFRPLKHTLSGRDEKTMMKLIIDKASRKILGLHVMGLDAPEIVQGFAVAIKAGATKDDFDATVGIHPTSAEELVTLREPLPEPEAKAAE